MTAPVQILVLGLDEPTLSVDVLAELERLRHAPERAAAGRVAGHAGGRRHT